MPALLVERLLHVLLDQHEVRRHALLTSVEASHAEHTLGRQRQIGVLGDEHGVLASQLQRHGRQVPRSLLHDDATHVVIPGEEDVVELLRQQRRRRVSVSPLLRTDHLHNSNIKQSHNIYVGSMY